YCGQIRYVDDMLCKVIDKLEEKKILNNTIVIFWSDHGEFLGDYGVTHKQLAFYECLIKIPLLIFDPTGSLKPGDFRVFTEAMDVMATIFDIIGLPQVKGSRAQSLVSKNYKARVDVFAEGGLYFQTPQKPFNNYVLKAPHDPSQWGPGAMIRNKNWKLCVYCDDRGELYDIKKDPFEMNNLFDDSEYTDIKTRMMHRLIQRQTCMGQAPELLPMFRSDFDYENINCLKQRN
ncbi:MAG TPA: hypothetical protein DC049_13200, partial [Spirochaetia bacterium]|nr:hypothetical protein [Spirochaetia bacterium]